MGEMPMEEGNGRVTLWERLRKCGSSWKDGGVNLGISELIVNTIVWDHAQRLRSYDLLAKEMFVSALAPSRT